MEKQLYSVGEFLSLVRDILRTPAFLKMKRYRHHINSTLYAHSLKVAFLCYKYHKRHPRMAKRISLRDFVRGALLHDYYRYDLHGDGQKHTLHWFKHPGRAMENAAADYPLCRVQRDMIKHHMFPLTLNPPKTRAGWLVCFFDKVAAVHDRFAKKN
jgi:uncharacterized protein